jgi:mannose-1-phosphate guanylyltransferase
VFCTSWKPDLATAEGFLRAGGYWNLAWFSWRDVFIAELGRHAPRPLGCGK